jgi:hypothetical protein
MTMLHKVWSLLLAHKVEVLTALVIVSTWVQAITPKYNNVRNVFAKLGLLLVDWFAAQHTPGTKGTVLGNIKIPFIPTLPDKTMVDGKAAPLVGIFLLAALALPVFGGCCSTPRCYLARSLTAIGAADKLVVAELKSKYEPRIKACGAVAKNLCAAYVELENVTKTYTSGMVAAGDGLKSCNRALDAAGVK